MRILDYQKYLVLLIIPIFIIVLLLTHPAYNAAYWLDFWWLFPIAFVVALSVNTLGISSAALFVPFFVLIFPLAAKPLSGVQSVELGLITESFGLSSSALAFLAFGLVDKKLAFYSIIGALPLVIGGAMVTSYLPKTALYLMIAALLISSVVLVTFEKTLKNRRTEELKSKEIDRSIKGHELVVMTSKANKTFRYCRTPSGYRKRFFGYSIGGFFQGAAGFGIGEMGIVSMILSDIPTRIAIGTSHLIVATTAIAASITHLALLPVPGEQIPWNLPLMTVPAVIIGGQLAPYLAAKLPTKTLEIFISILFFVIAVSLVILAVKS